MAAKPLLPISQALAAIQSSIDALPPVVTPISEAHGHYAARTQRAVLSHPASDVSAMDGYAVRAIDVETLPSTLNIIDESAAGRPAKKSLEAGTAIRIFTGGVVPAGADCIILQEDAIQVDHNVIVNEASVAGRYIRSKGQDFQSGDALLTSGKQLTARDIALLASAGISEITTLPIPRIAIINSGDELVDIGAIVAPGQLVNSNGVMRAAMFATFGGHPIDLGMVPDRSGALDDVLRGHDDIDLIITTGGASVGGYDHIISDLEANPHTVLNYWRIAMRPGKPLIFAHWNDIPLLGLPGNPVSAGVCALLFVQIAIAALQGRNVRHSIRTALLTVPLPENDKREDYMRAKLSIGEDGKLIATPAKRQDSAMLSLFADADGLIIRPPFANPLNAGDVVQVLQFPSGF